MNNWTIVSPILWYRLVTLEQWSMDGTGNTEPTGERSTLYTNGASFASVTGRNSATVG